MPRGIGLRLRLRHEGVSLAFRCDQFGLALRQIIERLDYQARARLFDLFALRLLVESLAGENAFDLFVEQLAEESGDRRQMIGIFMRPSALLLGFIAG